MRAVLAGLELVLLVEGYATPVAETGLLQPIGHDILGDVGGIAHAVDIADLVAVVGGDGHLGDPHPRIVELDDDLGVEVEAVGVPLERELLAGRPPSRHGIREWNSVNWVPRAAFSNRDRIRFPTYL